MNYKHHIMVFTAIITVSFAAGAQEVYESVDKQGVVEFSDQHAAGAKAIDIRPNVVNVAPVDIDTSQPASATGDAKTPAGSVQTEVVREGVADDYHGNDESRREMHQQSKEQHKDVVRQPLRKETSSATVHEGVHRR